MNIYNINFSVSRIIKANSCIFTTRDQIISCDTHIYCIHFIFKLCIDEFELKNNATCNAIMNVIHLPKINLENSLVCVLHIKIFPQALEA